MIRAFCILLFSLLTTVECYAQGKSVHEIDFFCEECIEENPTTVGMIDCIADAMRQWDSELNHQYQRLKDSLSEEAMATLKTSQLAWIDHRDKEFEMINTVYGSMDGTMYRIIAISQKMEFVKARTLKLKSYADEFTEP